MDSRLVQIKRQFNSYQELVKKGNGVLAKLTLESLEKYLAELDTDAVDTDKRLIDLKCSTLLARLYSGTDEKLREEESDLAYSILESL